MAMVILTFKVMPTSPEVNMENLTKQVETKITSYGGDVKESKLEPVAFGLKAIIIRFSLDEAKGSTDPLEDSIKEIKEVTTVDTIAVSRAMG